MLINLIYHRNERSTETYAPLLSHYFSNIYFPHILFFKMDNRGKWIKDAKTKHGLKKRGFSLVKPCTIPTPLAFD